MKKTIKKIFSLIIVFCMACVGLISTPITGVKAADVSSSGSYVKVTEEPTDWSGDYLIVYEAGNLAFNGGLTTLDAVSNTISVTITDGVIVANATTNAAKFTIDADGYIKSASGYYIGQTSDANGLKSSASTKYTNELSLNNDDTVNIVSGGAYLRYNHAKDQLRFRYYKSSTYTGQKAICLYKLIETGGEVTPVPSVTVNGDNSYTQVGTPITLTAELANVSGEVAWASTNTDVATVAGGEVTPIAMGKTTITATIGEASDSMDVTVYPVADSALTIAEALQVCELTGETNAPYTYSTTGVIESIDTAYDSTNDRITVTITDGTDSIQAYRMAGGGDLEVGTQITVTGTLVNYKSNTPEFVAGCTYEIVVDETAEEIKSALNAVNAYMSLSYKYKETTSSEVTDTLNRATTGVTGTTYAKWSDKTATSDAVYAGQSAGGNDSIQLRSSNSNSGIVTTTSGGKAKKITVIWNSATTSGRTLNVYGKNTAYSAPTELYNDSNQGTKLGTIVYGTSTELVIDGDYEYIGLRSNSGAMYLSEIQITWGTNSGGGTKTETVLTDSEFRFRCGVDATLLDIKDVTEYGIRVTANEKTVDYTKEPTSWPKDEEKGMIYVIISLGNIINDIDKLTTEFTVQAYVVYDGVTYCSTSTKTYSVASIIKMYVEELGYGDNENVKHLYQYLQGKSLI